MALKHGLWCMQAFFPIIPKEVIRLVVVPFVGSLDRCGKCRRLAFIDPAFCQADKVNFCWEIRFYDGDKRYILCRECLTTSTSVLRSERGKLVRKKKK